MLQKLNPDAYYKSIFTINIENLKESDIKGIIVDIDNTIVPWNDKKISDEVFNWFKNLIKEGFRLCLISNGMTKRVEYFSNQLDIPAIGTAVKPRKKAFRKALKILGLKKEKVAVIGDQIFTDVLGGNRMGFMTILVDPLNKDEFITTKIMRFIEKIVFNRGMYHD
ncbi:MAG: YqeG family HAD IIIA-type phosphatase [Halanaerobiales bacterium]|nr:YqeG family HAD IIIA-type phosphatase [Halanaerobiales bacterium]